METYFPIFEYYVGINLMDPTESFIFPEFIETESVLNHDCLKRWDQMRRTRYEITK